MAKFESKLSNEKFLEKAPEKVIQETRNRLDEAKKKADKLNQVLRVLMLVRKIYSIYN